MGLLFTTTHKSRLDNKILVKMLRTKEREVATLGTRKSLNRQSQKARENWNKKTCSKICSSKMSQKICLKRNRRLNRKSHNQNMGPRLSYYKYSINIGMITW